jgi:hypothetical protein
MAKLRLVDAFPTKSGAQNYANTLRRLKVQYVRIKKIDQGRLKYGVYVGGKNSSMY